MQNISNLLWTEIDNSRQPLHAVSISNDHISDGLVAFANPATQFDAASKKQIIYSGNATRGFDSNGHSWQGSTANSPVNIGATGGIETVVDTTKTWSFSCRVYIANTDGTEQIIASDLSSDVNFGAFVVEVNANQYKVIGWDSSMAVTSVSGGTVSVGIHDILAVYTCTASNFYISLYVDGVLLATSSTSAAAMHTNVASALRLCNPGLYTAAAAWPGKLYYAAIFQGDKSPYARQLHDNPWQLLSPPAQIIYHQFTSAAQNIEPALFTNVNSFYTQLLSSSINLTAGLFANSNSFYSQTLSAGAVDLTPSLFANNQTYYSHSISTDGAPQPLTPALYTNNNVFNAHTLSVGAVNLLSSLYANVNTFYTQTISSGSVTLTSSLFVNSNVFNAHSVSVSSVNLTPALFANNNSFYNHVVSGEGALFPSLFINNNTFYSNNLSAGAVDLLPAIINNSNVFYNHTISTVGANQDLTPGLFVNSTNFYIATVSSDYPLTAPLLSNSNSFYAHSLAVGNIDLLPALFTNATTFRAHVISGAVHKMYPLAGIAQNYPLTGITQV